jgi:hypothetical protein
MNIAGLHMTSLDAILTFLEEIELSAREGMVPIDSFLPGIRVARGTLVFDRGSLRWPGDLLHEAGHIAVTPASLRYSLDDALVTTSAVPHAGEAEATAWAFAAIVHLQLPPSVLFHEGGYHSRSPGLITTFSCGVYPGAFGLSQAGMTVTSTAAESTGVPPYPHMTRWLRE